MRRLVLSAHRWAGLTVGLVLAVVGTTGSIMALEDEIVLGFGGGIVTVPVRDQAVLGLPQLLPHAQSAGKLQSLTVYGEPGRSARIQLAPAVKGGHAEARYLDPYSGALLPPARAEAFIEGVEDVHRRLASGDTGRIVTGICVLVLVPMVLAGAWLRWPRPWSWSRWFGLDPSLKGRPFLRALHLATGAWVLPMLLVSALTGPYWAHEWYKAGVHRLAGVPLPGGSKPADGTPPDLATSWAAFAQAVPAWSQVTWRPGATHSFTYLLPDASHSRERNRVEVDGQGTVVKHELHAGKTAGGRLVASMFVIHSGAWLGVPGRIAMLLGALSLPLFALTGWMMFLQRRRAGSAPSRAASDRELRNLQATSSPPP